MKKIIVSIVCLVITSLTMFSQDELVSAKDLYKTIDSFKTNVKDFEADVKWIQDKDIKGTLFFKNPQNLNFTDPSKQVICSNGYMLWSISITLTSY